MTVPKPLYIAPLAWLRPFVLLALALLSMASNAWAGRDQRSVVISITLEPDSLDPTTSPTSAIGEIVHYNVFEGLVKIQENGTVAPLLAQSWQVDEQGKRYTFALRRGVIFHDGSVFDARAVRFTLERALAPHSPNKAKKALFDLTLINHVEPLDYQIYADPGYYFGYDSAEFRDLVLRHGASTQPRERQRLFMAMQRHLAADAVNAWIFTPQVSTVARKGLRGLWMNYPISVHDIAALSWD